MSDVTTTQSASPASDEIIRVLQNSLYPGAKPESIALVLSYCRVNGLDPMLKPVHIVPTSVKVGPDKWETRDVLMPGIADYRIKAARSGEYGGKSEPEFGPQRTFGGGEYATAYPEWCRITVSRIVQGQARTFVAVERWLENYATATSKSDAPNRMWRKRPYGQLAKVAEAQALRMAFPEFSGGQPTAEEMEGKELFGGQTIEHAPPRTAASTFDPDDAIENSPPPIQKTGFVQQPLTESTPTPYQPGRTQAQWEAWLAKVGEAAAAASGRAEVLALGDRSGKAGALPSWVERELHEILAVAYARTEPAPAAEEVPA